MARWIGAEYVTVGEIGFLVRRVGENLQQADSYMLQDSPAMTNISREPRLVGWCGETNNVSIYAEGLARVVRVTANKRALIVAVPPAEVAAALDQLGWPELNPAAEQ